MKQINLLITVLFISILFPVVGQQVGIGTTNPSDALHINSGANDDPLRVQINGATKLRIFNNGGTAIGSNNASGTPANGLYVLGNTGMGVSNPTDKLSVNGDINFTGQLKTDGNAGAEGQILMADGAGGMQWGDLSRFKNFKSFPNPGLNFWTLPAGVTEVIVELWGAGSGGNIGGGGGAGEYVIALFEFSSPGASYTIDIGMGGTGAQPNTAGTGGESTTFNGPGVIGTLSAKGGFAVIGNTSPSEGGSGSFSSFFNAVWRSGEHGHSNQIRFDQYGNTSFSRVTHYGQGGTAYNGGNGGFGDVYAEDISTSTVLFNNKGRPGVHPGGGGGGGLNNDGADGYAIIRW